MSRPESCRDQIATTVQTGHTEKWTSQKVADVLYADLPRLFELHTVEQLVSAELTKNMPDDKEAA